MTSPSAAVYGLGGVLLVACLAAANMPQERDALPPRLPRETRTVGPDVLAVEVSSQAARLRTLLAQAPMPGASTRNPFSFGASRSARAAASEARAAVATEPAPVVVPPPLLTLMGVAEETTPAGPRRTAVVALRQAQGDPQQSQGAGGDSIYMVVEGDTVGDRYRVTKIGADAIELEDLLSKGFRRLALQ